GGSEPDALAQAARLGEQAGFDEINLNLGCPSDRVQAGRFGACLMREPGLVAEGIAAMVAAVDIPVTVKTRIGVDHNDSYEELSALVDKLAIAGCRTFIIHARKAWLKGLSPKENREIPPLRYEIAHRLKQDFPNLELIVNGGITNLDAAAAQLERVDGVMIGREAYHNPWLLADVDRRFHGDETPPPERRQIIQRLLPFIESELASGVPLQRISRHILGLFQGQPGARRWRRHLSENSHKKNADTTVIVEALCYIRPGGTTTD
ncbi:MAG TPA: tRNA dihydrouridine(20/20a) synthase DusA, partial [Chromatiaceae bacterium]|nr:tRNA dihydrouridine(20/20a) synthase DusA [Chromatiaceae bacterium]